MGEQFAGQGERSPIRGVDRGNSERRVRTRSLMPSAVTRLRSVEIPVDETLRVSRAALLLQRVQVEAVILLLRRGRLGGVR